MERRQVRHSYTADKAQSPDGYSSCSFYIYKLSLRECGTQAAFSTMLMSSNRDSQQKKFLPDWSDGETACVDRCSAVVLTYFSVCDRDWLRW